MKYTLLLLILCALLLSGCILFERYTTSEMVVDPKTGEQTVILTEHDAPAVQMFKSAVTPLTSGNWWGAAIAAATTAITTLLAAKKAKDAKKAKVESAKNEAAAGHAAILAENLRGVADPAIAAPFLEAAGLTQDAAGVRDNLRAIRQKYVGQ